MPNNSDENKEDLTRSQAEKINRLLSELEAKQSKIDADRNQIEEQAAKVQADAAKLAAEQARVDAAKDTVISDREALAAAQQKLIADQQLVAAGLADLNRWEAERAALLPKISAMLEASNQASAREAKRDATIDLYGKSLINIEAGIGKLIDMPDLLNQMKTAIKAGFELSGKQMADNHLLSSQIAEAVENVGSRQEEIYEGTTGRFNELGVQINAVQTSVDRIGDIVTRLFDFVISIKTMLEANNERLDKIAGEVHALQGHVTRVSAKIIRDITVKLETFTQIPEKIDIQVKNLNATIAKIKGETDSVVIKYNAMMDSMSLRAEAFELQVQGIKDLAGMLRENLRRGVEIEMGRLQGTMTDFAEAAVKAYSEIIKKSEIYDVIREIHLIQERGSIANQEIGQLVGSVSELVGDIDGSIKRSGLELIENLSISSRAIQTQMNGIEDTVHRANSNTADSLARIESANGAFDSLGKKANSVLLSLNNITEVNASNILLIADGFTKHFVKMAEELRADLPAMIADAVTDKMAELDIVSMTKLLGGEDPEEQ